MANLALIDATGGTVFVKARGAGTDIDPHITEQDVGGTVAVNGTVQAAQSGDWNVGGTVSLNGTPTINAVQSDAWNVGGTVDVASVAAPSTIYNGQTIVTTAGTAVALTTTQAISSGVTVKGLSTNTGIVYVGNGAVDSTNGFELSAGEAIFIDTDDLASVHVDAAVSGEGVSWISS